jgi:hypothetical protein
MRGKIKIGAREQYPYCTAVKTRQRFNDKPVWRCSCLACNTYLVDSTRPAEVQIVHHGSFEKRGSHAVYAPAD